VDPDRSSRAAARRIVEEVLAEHAARASSRDGVSPVDMDMPERPDTPSWRAARRIVEETLAEHTARSAVPALLDLDVVDDLEALDAAVVLDLDGPPPSPAPVTRASPRESEPTVTEDPVEDEPVDVDPVAADLLDADPVDADPGKDELEEAEPEGTTAPDMAASTAVASRPDAAEPDEAPLGPADEAVLRAALSDRLFASFPEPDQDDRPAAGVLAGDAVSSNGHLGDPHVDPHVEPVDEGPPALPASRQLPLDPDDPTVIAARIVADVLADRDQARGDAADEPDAPGPVGAPEEDRDTAVSTGILAIDPEAGSDELAAAEASGEAVDEHAGNEDGATNGSGDDLAWWTPGIDESQDPDDRSGPDLWPEPVLATSEPPHDGLEPNEGVDRLWSEPRPEPGPVDVLLDDPYGALATEDEFGEWPDPIAPPRRTGRWLVTTVLGAVLLAFLLPLAVGALRDLVSFS
jgi:hypothetical protein